MYSTRLLRFWPFLIVVLLSGRTVEAQVDFNRDVRPILSDKCFKCHGPDASSREGDLRLDRYDDAKHVLEIKKDDLGELIRRIKSTDNDEKMPPPNSGIQLSAKEVDTLTRWVKGGASYQKHWSYRPISSVTAPPIQDKPNRWYPNAKAQQTPKPPQSERARPSAITKKV